LPNFGVVLGSRGRIKKVMEKGWVLFICLFRGVRILHFLCMSIFLNQRIDPKSEMQFNKSNIGAYWIVLNQVGHSFWVFKHVSIIWSVLSVPNRAIAEWPLF
jgi:hypothetical protein